MKLRKYIEEKASEWVGYNRPAVDWMVTEKGNPNKRLKRTMHDFPEFGKVVEQIPRPLSRQDVFNCYKEDPYKGFVATLLWDRFCQEPFHIYLFLPFLAEPADAVRAKLKETTKHIVCGDMSLSELYTACETPSLLQLAHRINQSEFTLALDYLAADSRDIIHPLMFNTRMMNVHCALLLEDLGTSQPFYDIDGEKIAVSADSSAAECYEDYCRRLGDMALWAGCGNPEYLVDWLNYSADGRATYPIAKEIITLFRLKINGYSGPSGTAMSLAEFIQQGFQSEGDINEFFADFATKLYMGDEANQVLMLQILKDNDLIEKRTQYDTYSRVNKGCSLEQPLDINIPWKDRFHFESAIVDYILLWSSPQETHRELLNITMHCRGRKWIESLEYGIYRGKGMKRERYYFDLTDMFNQ